MNIIEAGISVTAPNVKKIDTASLKTIQIHEAPQQVYDNFIQAQQRFLEAQYTQLPDTSKNPNYDTYATIERNGKIIAEIDNNGFVKSSNALGAVINNALTNNEKENGLSGPELAEHRAEYIAELLGGNAVKSSTSITQLEFYRNQNENRPVIDIDTLRNDPLYEQLIKTKNARSLFLAQKIAQDRQL